MRWLNQFRKFISVVRSIDCVVSILVFIVVVAGVPRLCAFAACLCMVECVQCDCVDERKLRLAKEYSIRPC